MQKNKGQQQAIETINGQLLIIAGPGSGKTTTMLKRINAMVAEHGIDPMSILMITFTKAAAEEMMGRYKRDYGDPAGITFSTIHALCWNILRIYEGYQQNQICSEHDKRAFLYDCIKKDYSINDKDSFVNNLLTDITVVNNNMIRPEEYEASCTTDKKKFSDLYRAYERHKKEIGQIDFDDMQNIALKVIKKNKDVLEALRGRFKYIMVDEYQDTNIVQRDLVYLIAGKNANLAVVGDDDQSIYGFRGARPEIMLGFTKDYPEAKTVYLDVNYRSLPIITKNSLKLIAHNHDRFDKDLKNSREGKGEYQEISCLSRESEIETLTTRIKEDLKHGLKEEDIAVLYRTNQQSERIAAAMFKAKINFYSNDSFKCKYEHWIFEDIMSYHRIGAGIGEKSDFFRVINHPNRYLNKECAFCGNDKGAMMLAASKGKKESWQVDSALKNVNNFFQLTGKMTGKPYEGITAMALSKYTEYLREYPYEDPTTLVQMWEELKKEAKTFDSWEKWENYSKQYIFAMNEVKRQRTGVTLSTMHKAKGLEWKKVYIIDCVNGIIPYVKAKDMSSLEEERRLFYVAMTRAKDSLICMSYQTNGSKNVKETPYFQEIREEPSQSRKSEKAVLKEKTKAMINKL